MNSPIEVEAYVDDIDSGADDEVTISLGDLRAIIEDAIGNLTQWDHSERLNDMIRDFPGGYVETADVKRLPDVIVAAVKEAAQ